MNNFNPRNYGKIAIFSTPKGKPLYTGQTKNGVKFTLALSDSSKTPIVILDEPKENGPKAFILFWEDVLQLAEEAGLFDTNDGPAALTPCDDAPIDSLLSEEVL